MQGTWNSQSAYLLIPQARKCHLWMVWQHTSDFSDSQRSEWLFQWLHQAHPSTLLHIPQHQAHPNKQIPLSWQNKGLTSLCFVMRENKKWITESGVNELDWATQSPYLNMTKHFWDEWEWGLRTSRTQATSVFYLILSIWKNGQNSYKDSAQPHGQPSHKSWSCNSCKKWSRIILNPMG